MTGSVTTLRVASRAVSGLRAFVAAHGRGGGGCRRWRDGGTPVLRDVWTLESPASGGGKRLGFVVGGVRCEVAVACPDGVPGAGLRSPILLLRRCDPAGPLLYDNLYLVELAGMRLLQVVDTGGDDGTLRLSREGCGDTLVDRTAVASLWFVCAAIDRLVRQGAFRIVASRSVPSFLVTFCLSCPVLFRPVPSYPAPLFRRDRRSFIQRRPVRPDCRVHHSPTRRGKSELNMKNVICSSVRPVQSIPSSSVPPRPTELYSTSSRPPGLPGTPQPDEAGKIRTEYEKCHLLFRPARPIHPATPPLFRRNRRSFTQHRPVRPVCRVHSPTRARRGGECNRSG